jgi:hypothetical protein
MADRVNNQRSAVMKESIFLQAGGMYKSHCAMNILSCNECTHTDKTTVGIAWFMKWLISQEFVGCKVGSGSI